ncbi:DUF5131 family protein [uncultured Paracoccus sp.]|uniref:DUF5131 family protein n=1 Tax=Paracoccus sp. S1E-3 TaxID=2756130 RepID=UPI00351AA944
MTGCTKVGPGCDNCYAERFAERWRGIPGHPYEQGFDLTLWPSRLKQPVLWKKPRMPELRHGCLTSRSASRARTASRCASFSERTALMGSRSSELCSRRSRRKG